MSPAQTLASPSVPRYALLRAEQPTAPGAARYFSPIQIHSTTDSDAVDAALDKITASEKYVLVRLVADFEHGVQTAQYKA